MSQNISFTRGLENEVTSSVGPSNKIKLSQNVLTFNMTMKF